MKFEIIRSLNATQPFYFILRAKNGEVVLTSEMYARKESCYKTIRSIKRSVGVFTRVVDRTL
jgi:uncharacterized protein YegP (UPF0339 family)